jgi:lysophospholipase L1-like esterase
MAFFCVGIDCCPRQDFSGGTCPANGLDFDRQKSTGMKPVSLRFFTYLSRLYSNGEKRNSFVSNAVEDEDDSTSSKSQILPRCAVVGATKPAHVTIQCQGGRVNPNVPCLIFQLVFDCVHLKSTMTTRTDGLMMVSSSSPPLLGSYYPMSRQTRVILTVMGFVTVASGLAIGLSRFTNSTTTIATTTKQQRHYRVLAFGDSLTAGMVRDPSQQSVRYHPYADALRETLATLLLADDPNTKNSAAGDDDDGPLTVEHEGRPGWTSLELYKILPDDLPYDVMIILAGTNDLGRSSAETIASQLHDLHEAALRRGVTHTMAVAIPESAYQLAYAEAHDKAVAINQSIQAWSDDRITYVPFPFSFDRQDPRWHMDGLHLSEQGYDALGQYLAPLVYHELQQLATNHKKQQQRTTNRSVLLR